MAFYLRILNSLLECDEWQQEKLYVFIDRTHEAASFKNWFESSTTSACAVVLHCPSVIEAVKKIMTNSYTDDELQQSSSACSIDNRKNSNSGAIGTKIATASEAEGKPQNITEIRMIERRESLEDSTNDRTPESKFSRRRSPVLITRTLPKVENDYLEKQLPANVSGSKRSPSSTSAVTISSTSRSRSRSVISISSSTSISTTNSIDDLIERIGKANLGQVDVRSNSKAIGKRGRGLARID